MEKLSENIKVVLATTFAWALKAQGFHWNVEGPNFHQYHALFGELYEEAFEACDDIAEHGRTLDEYMPASLGRFYQLSAINCEPNVPQPREMVRKLEEDNKVVIDVLTEAYKEAEAQSKLGLANYLQDRIDTHEKHGWMLRATLKD